MNNKVLIMVVGIVMISANVTGCATAAASTLATEQTAISAAASADVTEATVSIKEAVPTEATAEATAQEQEITAGESLIEVSTLDALKTTIACLYSAFGNEGLTADTTPANVQVITYLSNMAGRYYSDRAEIYDGLGTESKYIALGEEEVNQLLDKAFAGRYSTAELLTDNTQLIYNAKMYYIPFSDAGAAIDISFDSAGSESNQYIYRITDQGTDIYVTVALELSGENPIGYSVASFSVG